MLKNKKYYAEKIMNMGEADRKQLFADMLAHRKQHRQECRVSGWSEKYNKLLKEMFETVDKFFPEDKDDLFRTDKIWDVISDLYLYN